MMGTGLPSAPDEDRQAWESFGLTGLGLFSMVNPNPPGYPAVSFRVVEGLAL
jgi:hypothetical protein